MPTTSSDFDAIFGDGAQEASYLDNVALGTHAASGTLLSVGAKRGLESTKNENSHLLTTLKKQRQVSPGSSPPPPASSTPTLQRPGWSMFPSPGGSPPLPASRAASSGASPSVATPTASGGSPTGQCSWALICACNMNRSMSAHALLHSRGFSRVHSYGVNDLVRLPGRFGPVPFPFGVPYTQILSTLESGGGPDAAWVQAQGLRGMLARNSGVKVSPESWFALADHAVKGLDWIVCFDRSVYAAIVRNLQARSSSAVGAAGSTHVLGPAWSVLLIATVDSLGAADIAAQHAARFAEEISAAAAAAAAETKRAAVTAASAAVSASAVAGSAAGLPLGRCGGGGAEGDSNDSELARTMFAIDTDALQQRGKQGPAPGVPAPAAAAASDSPGSELLSSGAQEEAPRQLGAVPSISGSEAADATAGDAGGAMTHQTALGADPGAPGAPVALVAVAAAAQSSQLAESPPMLPVAAGRPSIVSPAPAASFAGVGDNLGVVHTPSHRAAWGAPLAPGPQVSSSSHSHYPQAVLAAASSAAAAPAPHVLDEVVQGPLRRLQLAVGTDLVQLIRIPHAGHKA